MSNLEFILVLFATLAACAGLSVGAVRASRADSKCPLPGGVLRLKCVHGVYRSRFLGMTANGWRVTAPLTRDSYVPLRPGDPVVIEAPIDGSALLARTSVLERDAETHELVLARPSRRYRLERREAERRCDTAGIACTVEGKPALLLDVSAFGARVRCSGVLAAGDRVRLDLAWCEEPAFGWVLEVIPAAETAGSRTICRIRFEDRVRLPASA